MEINLTHKEELKQILENSVRSIYQQDKVLVDERCKSVLEYLIPNHERVMTARQYNNAMEALRSIAFGVPKGKKLR